MKNATFQIFSTWSNKTEKEPKMKVFDFGAFQIIMQLLSHEKKLLQLLFWTFHITYLIINIYFWIHKIYKNLDLLNFHGWKIHKQGNFLFVRCWKFRKFGFDLEINFWLFWLVDLIYYKLFVRSNIGLAGYGMFENVRSFEIDFVTHS